MASPHSKNRPGEPAQGLPREPQRPLEPGPFSYPPEPRVKFRGEGEGLLHIMSFESSGHSEFAVMWAPFRTSGGAVPNKRFGTEDELTNFLRDELKVKDRWIRRAMSDLAFSRTAEIQLRLSEKEVKEHGLAGSYFEDSGQARK